MSDEKKEGSGLENYDHEHVTKVDSLKGSGVEFFLECPSLPDPLITEMYTSWYGINGKLRHSHPQMILHGDSLDDPVCPERALIPDPIKSKVVDIECDLKPSQEPIARDGLVSVPVSYDYEGTRAAARDADHKRMMQIGRHMEFEAVLRIEVPAKTDGSISRKDLLEGGDLTQSMIDQMVTVSIPNSICPVQPSYISQAEDEECDSTTED